jgi:hypothetical protein
VVSEGTGLEVVCRVVGMALRLQAAKVMVI